MPVLIFFSVIWICGNPIDAAAQNLASGSSAPYSVAPLAVGYPHHITQWDYEGFKLGFCKIKRTPVWVAYELARSKGIYSFARPSFRIDPNFRSLSTSAYSKTGYDRGHMAPNYAIMSRYGRKAQIASFNMTNMVPMNASLNRGVWASIEGRVAREYANAFEQVWVVTGPIFDEKPQRLPSGVEIPDSFYKIVIDEVDSKPRALALELRNVRPVGGNLNDYLVSIDSIERKTGLNFFHLLKDSIENQLESKRTTAFWETQKGPAFISPGADRDSISSSHISAGGKKEPDEKRFWISSTGKTHNASCRYFGTTKKGNFVSRVSGDNCKICGGSK
jgi:endonuclease G